MVEKVLFGLLFLKKCGELGFNARRASFSDAFHSFKQRTMKDKAPVEGGFVVLMTATFTVFFFFFFLRMYACVKYVQVSNKPKGTGRTLMIVLFFLTSLNEYVFAFLTLQTWSFYNATTTLYYIVIFRRLQK